MPEKYRYEQFKKDGRCVGCGRSMDNEDRKFVQCRRCRVYKANRARDYRVTGPIVIRPLPELVAEGVKAYGGECVYCGNKKIEELRFVCVDKTLREKLLAFGGGKAPDAIRVIARRGWKHKSKFVVSCKDGCKKA